MIETAPAPLVHDLLRCPRCGERHAELKVHQLTSAHWTMCNLWAWCPTLQQPIVFLPENAGLTPSA